MAKAAVGDGPASFKAGITKLSMNDILNLFNRNTADEGMAAGNSRLAGIANRTRVLNQPARRFEPEPEPERERGGGRRWVRAGEETRKEDPIYGRRW